MGWNKLNSIHVFEPRYQQAKGNKQISIFPLSADLSMLQSSRTTSMPSSLERNGEFPISLGDEMLPNGEKYEPLTHYIRETSL